MHHTHRPHFQAKSCIGISAALLSPGTVKYLHHFTVYIGKGDANDPNTRDAGLELVYIWGPGSGVDVVRVTPV